MRFLTADTIYPISGDPVSGQVIVLHEDGKVDTILPESEVDAGKVERHAGSICPGFVNTHCHLELSYMKGKIAPGSGLHNFIKEVEKLKKPGDEEIQEAIRRADEEMLRSGIVAVADICNTSNTFAWKNTSRIFYYNFIEIYAFDESRAEAAFEKGKKLQDELQIKAISSITPHAPYSASQKLLHLFADEARKHNKPLSIHNQETEEEDLFFRHKKGNILERLNYFGIDTSGWHPPGISSLQYTLPQLPEANKVLLVHNTFTTEEDIRFANSHNQNLFWCFCPNANLYIENKLPDVSAFLRNKCRITLGTDSYASNWSLSIWDEILALRKHFPSLELKQLLEWATRNGAEFLGIDGVFGSLEKNKRPGLNLISPDLSAISKLV